MFIKLCPSKRQDAGIGRSERQHTLPVEDNYGFEPRGGSCTFCSLLMTIDQKLDSIVAKFTTSSYFYIITTSIFDFTYCMDFPLAWHHICSSYRQNRHSANMTVNAFVYHSEVCWCDCVGSQCGIKIARDLSAMKSRSKTPNRRSDRM